MPLDTPADRIRWARKRHNRYQTPTEAAQALNIVTSTYLGYENGDRTPSRDAAKRISRAYGVRWEWLLEADGPPTRKAHHAPIVGHVGAGAEMYFDAGQGPFGEVIAPPGSSPEIVAVEVRGGSLGPFSGWFAYFERKDDPPTPDMIGRLCVVGLADGSVLIKTVMRGSRSARFHLLGAGGDPLEDQQIEWSAKVIAILAPEIAKAI